MITLKPYLIRAIHDWIMDNNETTYMLVQATYPYTIVPVEFVKHGKIVLNISPVATKNLIIDNEQITFNAKFSGIDSHIIVPVPAVLSIYSKECGKGMVFDPNNLDPNQPDPNQPNLTKKHNPKPKLRIVK